VKVHIIGNINPLNNGWRLLFISVTRFLSAKFPNIEFTKESLLPQIDEKLNPTCRCVKSMKSSVTLLVSTLIRALFWRLLKPLKINAAALFNEPLRYYYEADVIIDLSGDGLCPPQSKGFWYSVAKVLFKLANLASILIAIVLGKRVIIYSASIGNLGILIPLASLILNNVDLIAVRDHESMEYLRRIKVTKPVIYFAPDAAFSLQIPNKNKALKNGHMPVIGFNLSTEAVQHFHRVDLQHFARLIGSIISDISESLNATVMLIPFSLGGPFKHDDDRIILNEVLKHTAGGNISIMMDKDPFSTVNAISRCNILVTMRMHPAIISLLCGVPPLVVSHSPKFQGLIKLIGIRDLLCTLPQSDLASLKEKILHVWRNKDVLCAQIEKRAGDLVAASLNGLERMALMLREIAGCRQHP